MVSRLTFHQQAFEYDRTIIPDRTGWIYWLACDIFGYNPFGSVLLCRLCRLWNACRRPCPVLASMTFTVAPVWVVWVKVSCQAAGEPLFGWILALLACRLEIPLHSTRIPWWRRWGNIWNCHDLLLGVEVLLAPGPGVPVPVAGLGAPPGGSVGNGYVVMFFFCWLG
jgi:hypothetical protein